MISQNFHFSDSFIKKFVELTEGLLSSELFEIVISKLEEDASKYYYNLQSEANLLRIFSSIYDKTFFFSELPRFPHHSEIITAIAASSNYLTDIAVRHPEYLYQLFDQEYLAKEIIFEELEKEVYEGVRKFKSLPTRLTFLRRFKQRIMLKIGTSDILHFDELQNTTKQLSHLANAISKNLFEVCYDDVLNKYNIKPPQNKFALCSLGKLGGGELNYSSDIDLVLFYDFNSSVESTNKDFHEILSETVQLFSKSASELTPNGYIFRLDFRLRPDGKYSPLCKAMNDYIKYYETRGEDWERQMLIKLNFVCGDKYLYDSFISFVTPYVYQNFYTSSIKEKIKLMKQNIERQHNKKDDVKTFTGGIRDIEFSIQALQLLNGGKFKELRTGNSLAALEVLKNNKLLSKGEKDLLTDAYIFYRRIEHFLQLMNDMQTHSIPDNDDTLTKLTNYLQLSSINDFKIKLEHYRTNVRNIYSHILKSDAEKKGSETLIPFRDKASAEKNLMFLQSGVGIIERKEFDSRTIQNFNLIEPVLVDYLQNCVSPDRVVENFARVIRTTRFPSIWYGEFSSTAFFKDFLRICEYSQKTIDLLSSSSRLEDHFTSRKAFTNISKEDFANITVEQLVLSLSVQFTLGLIKQNKLAEVLAEYFKHQIAEILYHKHLPYNYFVAALGSLGYASMNFNSDIDLVVVVDDISKAENVQSHFQEFLITAKEKFKPFEVDFRLRPEGNKSPIVWDLKNYDTYLSQRARVWEFQALTKISFVCGDEKLFAKFNSSIAAHSKRFSSHELKAEIAKMHSATITHFANNLSTSINLKKDKGALLTIDFILQTLLLSKNDLLKSSLIKNYKSVFHALEKHGVNLDNLKSNFARLKQIELSLQNVFNQNNSALPKTDEDKNLIVSFLKTANYEMIENEIKTIFKSNFAMFEKFLEEVNKDLIK